MVKSDSELSNEIKLPVLMLCNVCVCVCMLVKLSIIYM